MIHDLHIHGDNIVECERALNLILQSLEDMIENCTLLDNSVVCPCYSIKLKNNNKQTRKITFFPGYGRWEVDILTAITDRGGTLREAADAIVTEVINNEERFLFAIEFCGALPAGNQAWQRSGRAYSYGAAKIPYLYISELGGYELDVDRNRKAPRMPNPAVPFSYLSFSIECDTPVFPIFVAAPDADDLFRENYASEFAGSKLLNFVKSTILHEDASGILLSLQEKVFSFVRKRSETSRNNETLSPSHWKKAYERVQSGKSISSFLIEEVRQNWSKTTHIKSLTKNAKNLMDFGKRLGIGLTSTKLPICLLDIKGRREFLDFLDTMYPQLDSDFKKWLNETKPLGICWITGYKPQGDDARPDRGLTPFARMLLGSDHDLLSIIYGPAHKQVWENLENSPQGLSNQNGLWEAIMETSDAVLVESTTDQDITRKGYTSLHWNHNLSNREPLPFIVPTQPSSFNENDVDTVIHLLLSQLCGDSIFEGMCNPPGGDWSGVSILSNGNELRWVSLPRVSGDNTKRPDHVFQILIKDESSIILSIESKYRPGDLEENIGPRLTKYLKHLFKSNASIERSTASSTWTHSSAYISLNNFQFASAGAFIGSSVEADMAAVKRSGTDLNFSVSFNTEGKTCNIDVYILTEVGEKVAKYIKENLSREDMIIISIMPSENYN